MSLKTTAIAIVLLLVCSATIYLFLTIFVWGGPSEREILEANCAKLKLGMSRDDVIGTMGKPEKVYYVHREWQTRVEENWYYDDPHPLLSSSSTPLRCQFDSLTGILYSFQCNDTLSRSEPRRKDFTP